MRLTFAGRNRLKTLLNCQTAIAGSVALGATAIAANDAGAVVVVSQTNQVADFSSIAIDINADGAPDLMIKDNGDFSDARGMDRKFPNGFTKAKVATDKRGFAKLFQPGGVVDKTNAFSTKALLSDYPEGPFSVIGTTGYIGLLLISEFFSRDEEEQDVVERNSYFGWLELTRGSITTGALGLQNVSGAAAPIPNNTPNPVPVPPGIALMATGALGLAAIRRRKKAA